MQDANPVRRLQSRWHLLRLGHGWAGLPKQMLSRKMTGSPTIKRGTDADTMYVLLNWTTSVTSAVTLGMITSIHLQHSPVAKLECFQSA